MIVSCGCFFEANKYGSMKSPKKKINQVEHQGSSFFDKKEAGRNFYPGKDKQFFFPKTPMMIQKQPEHETAPMHDQSLDKFSEETGMPRETASVPDPLYYYWITGTSLPQRISIYMPVPDTNPAPDFTKDENSLNAWEQANFLFNPIVPNLIVESNFSGGQEVSYVRRVSFGYANPSFEFFIASHILENSIDQTKDPKERRLWDRLKYKINEHAIEHFNRYRAVVQMEYSNMYKELDKLPTFNTPIPLPKAELEKYVQLLLQFLMENLRHELWKTTCDWEAADYPNIIPWVNKGQVVTLSVSNLPINCGPAPAVSKKPTLPIIVKAKPPKRK
jgi:hypothetical protein